MSEFKVNEFITLKLENGKSNIYINGELFNQCKYILTRKKVDELEALLEIESVDELSQNLDHSLEIIELDKIDIPLETRFWVHCSNLQVWCENNYDTKLLHRNLAFPLLKRLVEVGDPLAQKLFQEEIAKRIECGNLTVINYLILEGYLKNLPKEHLDFLEKNSKILEKMVSKIVEKPNFKKNIIKYINQLKKEGNKSNWVIEDISLEDICRTYEEIYNSIDHENYIEFLDGIEIFLWKILKKEIDKIFYNLDVDVIKDLFYIFDNNHDYEFVLENIILNKRIIIPLIKRCLVTEDLFKNSFLTKLNDRLKNDEKVYALVNLINCYVKFSSEEKLNNEIMDLILKVLFQENLSEFSNFIRLKLLKYLKLEDQVFLFKNNELKLLEKIIFAINNKISYENYDWKINELKEYNYSEFLEWVYKLFEELKNNKKYEKYYKRDNKRRNKKFF